MTEQTTFASKLTDYELSAFFELASKADLALMDLARITRDTGAEVQLKSVRKSVAMLTEMVMAENEHRCSHGR